MKYICLVYHKGSNPEHISDEEFEDIFRECDRWVGNLARDGKHVFSAGLQSTRTGRTVRAEDGKLATTDGPFAETKEWLGGFTVLEAENMEEAVDQASKLASITRGTVEVRPVIDDGATLTDPVDQRIAGIRRKMNHA